MSDHTGKRVAPARTGGTSSVASATSPGKRTLTEQVYGSDRATGGTLYRKPALGAPDAASPAVTEALESSGGDPLPGGVRSSVEQLTGGDLSIARVHTGPSAAAAAQALNARAFTHGINIFLGAGETASDTRLLAHEAAHALQTNHVAPQRKPVDVVAESDPAELEADRVADAVAGGASAPLPVARGAANRIARTPVNQVTTPDAVPLATPETIPPPAGERRTDAEGNTIRESSGHWYIAEDPGARLAFPHRPGKYQLYSINPNASYSALLSQCEAVKVQQLALAARLRGRDMKYWFAKVYALVTTVELEQIRAGTYQYPHMKMQEVIAFNNTYQANMTAWESGNRSHVEHNWRVAFAAAESENHGSALRTRTFEILHALLPSIQAHIRFDLPRAIAACYGTHYAGIPMTSLEDFHSDFNAMNPVFDEAQNRLRPEIGDETWFGGNATMQGVGNAFFGINVQDERNITWEKTDALVRAHDHGTNSQDNVVAQIEGSHPMRTNGDFEVDGERINDYDWDHQPGMRADPRGPGPQYDPAPAMPAFPARLYFKQGLPNGDQPLEATIRDDQDLAPYRDLAQWTTQVRGARITLTGHASVEGPPWLNSNLSGSRATLVASFMLRFGLDSHINPVVESGAGVEGTTPDPQYRYVEVRVDRSHATSRQQRTPPNPNLPSEVTR